MHLYYWHGKGLLGWLIRKSTGGAWDHVALGFELDGVPCYFEALPLVGVRLVPLALDPPAAFQYLGMDWTPGLLRKAVLKLGQPYSLSTAVLAGLGFRARFHGEECAELVADVLGLPVVPTPENIAEEVECLTGNKVEVYQ